MVALLALLISTFILASNADGNVTCSGTGMDWYTDHVGETACKTYERMRQICDADFEVGTMSTNTPPDVCNDQNADCCCNSIAFALAMLCLNCQQNIGTGSGFDAGAGAYEGYLLGGSTSTCSPVHNQTLSTTVQAAVCNEEIKIFNDLYTLFWTNGAWFYIFTQETITEHIAAENNNTFTHCSSTTVNTTSSAGPSSTSSSTSSSISSSPSSSSSSIAASEDVSSSSSKLSGGAIGGIVVGVVAGLAGFALMLWFLWWKRRDINKVQPENQIDPFTPETREAYGQPGGFMPSNLYNYSALSQGDPYPPELVAGYSTQSVVTPSGYTGHPTQSGAQSSSRYGGSSTGARSDVPSQPDSRLISSSSEKGPRLYSNQSPTIPPTTATTSGVASTSPANSLASPGGHSYNQSLGALTLNSEPERDVDGGRVPQEMLDGRLPPAYGDQID